MPSEEELRTRMAEGHDAFEGGESASNTKHIPIQRVATSTLAEQEDYPKATEASPESAKLDSTDDRSGVVGEQASEMHPDVHKDEHLREQSPTHKESPRRDESPEVVETRIEPTFVTHEVVEVREGAAPTEVKYQLGDSAQIVVQQEEPHIQEVPSTESPAPDSTTRKEMSKTPEVAEAQEISSEHEFYRLRERGGGIEASLQDTPKHHESLTTPALEERSRDRADTDQPPHEPAIKHEMPEVAIGTTSAEQSQSIPVHHAAPEQSFDEEPLSQRDLLHSKSQLSDSPSELSLKSESTVIHVGHGGGEARQASADESPEKTGKPYLSMLEISQSIQLNFKIWQLSYSKYFEQLRSCR